MESFFRTAGGEDRLALRRRLNSVKLAESRAGRNKRAIIDADRLHSRILCAPRPVSRALFLSANHDLHRPPSENRRCPLRLPHIPPGARMPALRFPADQVPEPSRRLIYLGSGRQTRSPTVPTLAKTRLNRGNSACSAFMKPMHWMQNFLDNVQRITVQACLHR